MYRIIYVLIILFVSSLNVQAEELKKYYMSAKATISLMEFDDSEYYSTIGGNQNHEYDRSSNDSTFGGGFGIGVYLKNNIRAEIEYCYRSSFEYDKRPTNSGIANAHQELKTQSLIAHLFYDFPNQTKFTPFIFAGAGIAYHKTDANAQLLFAPFYNYTGSASDMQFAWDLGLGTGYAISDNISLDVSYRYVSLGEAEWVNNRTDGGDPSGSFADIISNEFQISVRYSF